MPVQGGNAIDHELAYAGMVADLQLCNGVSKLNKGTVNIPYGYGVVTDGDDGGALPTDSATANEFIGIVKYELNRAHLDSAPDGATPLFDMTVVSHGVVWVEALTGVAKDDPVFFVVGDGTGTNQGQFSNVIGAAATTAVQIVGAKWVSSAQAGSLAKISLGLGG